MKQLNNYIQEKLHIGQYKPTGDIMEKDPNFIVNYCKDKAKEKGLEVKFRNRKMPQGDFCFFIYDKSKQTRYLVGYDGDWDKDNEDFKKCANQTLKYIENYK